MVRETVQTGPTAKEIGRCQYMGLGKGCTSDFRSTIIEFNGKVEIGDTAEQIAELPKGLTFARTRIEHGESLSHRRLQEGRNVSNSIFVGRIEPAPHLSR